jgi:hypothetical protein
MAGQAGRGTFFLHIPGPSGPGCRIGAPLALANVGQRPINPIAQAIGLGCMGHIMAACRAAILFLMLMCMRGRGTGRRRETLSLTLPGDTQDAADIGHEGDQEHDREEAGIEDEGQ